MNTPKIYDCKAKKIKMRSIHTLKMPDHWQIFCKIGTTDFPFSVII